MKDQVLPDFVVEECTIDNQEVGGSRKRKKHPMRARMWKKETWPANFWCSILTGHKKEN